MCYALRLMGAQLRLCLTAYVPQYMRAYLGSRSRLSPQMATPCKEQIQLSTLRKLIAIAACVLQNKKTTINRQVHIRTSNGSALIALRVKSPYKFRWVSVAITQATRNANADLDQLRAVYHNFLSIIRTADNPQVIKITKMNFPFH